MADNEYNRSWWHTLPGVITATATLVSAIGGILVILNSNGFFSNYKTDDKAEPKNLNEKLNFEGNVGKLQATFNLTFDPSTNNIKGTYYYPARKNVIYEIKGVILTDGITLFEFTSGIKTATCTLEATGDGCYIGRMYNTNGKQYPMTLCKINNN